MSSKDSKAPSAFMKPVNLSACLEEIVGKGPMPRTQVTKLLWDYIKKNRLQNPSNKRQIVPDALLGKVLGTQEPIDMFKMSSLVSKQLTK